MSLSTQGKKLKPEFETEDDDEADGDVSDEDEAADIDDELKMKSQSPPPHSPSPNGTDQPDGQRQPRVLETFLLLCLFTKSVTGLGCAAYSDAQPLVRGMRSSWQSLSRS